MQDAAWNAAVVLSIAQEGILLLGCSNARCLHWLTLN
jgi:hypothetical protein